MVSNERYPASSSTGLYVWMNELRMCCSMGLLAAASKSSQSEGSCLIMSIRLLLFYADGPNRTRLPIPASKFFAAGGPGMPRACPAPARLMLSLQRIFHPWWRGFDQAAEFGLKGLHGGFHVPGDLPVAEM